MKVYVAMRPVDFRKGIDGLALAVQQMFGLDPFCGAVFVFRAKRADRVKIVWWDGSGICLYAKTIETTRFCWPPVSASRVRLNHAQLLALVDGMDWKKVRSASVRRPQSLG